MQNNKPAGYESSKVLRRGTGLRLFPLACGAGGGRYLLPVDVSADTGLIIRSPGETFPGIAVLLPFTSRFLFWFHDCDFGNTSCFSAIFPPVLPTGLRMAAIL